MKNHEGQPSPTNPSDETKTQPEFFTPLQDLPQAFNQQIRYMEGAQHGSFATSVLIADVPPGAGPPLHLHYTEEVQVLPECRADFLIGERRFTVQGPGVLIDLLQKSRLGYYEN